MPLVTLAILCRDKTLAQNSHAPSLMTLILLSLFAIILHISKEVFTLMIYHISLSIQCARKRSSSVDQSLGPSFLI